MSRLLAVYLAVLTVNAGVAARPDFSGTWKIDASRSTATGGGRGGGRGTGGGLGLGPSADQLTIRQDRNTLTIIEQRGNATTRLTYALGGDRTTNLVGAGKNTGALAASVSHWKDDHLVTTVTIAAPPQGGVPVRYQEVRYLDREGSLVVETTIPGQPNARTVAYRKQRNDAAATSPPR